MILRYFNLPFFASEKDDRASVKVEVMKSPGWDFSERGFLETLIGNCRFRSKDFLLRIISYRGHIMRDAMNSPPPDKTNHAYLLRHLAIPLFL